MAAEDRREAILLRILSLLGGISGAASIERNNPVLPEKLRPAIILHDGDEESVQAERRRDGRASTKITMTPVVIVGVSDSADQVGPSLNGFRAAITKTLLYDSTLLELAGENGGVHYLGCEMNSEKGARVEATMVLHFELTYVLHTNRL